MAQQVTASPKYVVSAGERQNQALKTAGKVLAFIFLVFFALLMFIPFIWALSTSLKTRSEVSTDVHLNWIPPHPTISAYFDAWQLEPFGLWYLNSIIVSVLPTLATLLLAPVLDAMVRRS